MHYNRQVTDRTAKARVPSRTISITSFLHELVLGWQKLRLYQPGHPERRAGLARAHQVLTALLAPTGQLALGVAPAAILAAEEKLTSRAAVRLADALYRLEVAVLRFEEGVEPWELETLIQLLSKAGEGSPPLWEALEAHGVPRVRAEPLELSGVVVAEREEETGAGVHQGLLWDDILQRLLADDRLGGTGLEILTRAHTSLQEVESVVREVLERLGSSNGEGAGTAELSGAAAASESDLLDALEAAISAAVGERLRGTAEGARRATTRHVVELLAVLPESLRRGVLDAALRELTSGAGSDGELKELTSGLPAAQVVGALRRLRQEQVVFSPPAVRLVEALLHDAVGRRAAHSLPVDAERLAAELRSFFGDEDVDRFQPPVEADRLLLALPRLPVDASPSAPLEERLESLTERRQLVTLGATLLDMLQRPFMELDELSPIPQRLEAVFRALLANGYLGEAVRLAEALDSLAEGTYAVSDVRVQAQRCAERLRDAETVEALVEALVNRDPSDRQLRHLIRLLGPPVVEGLLAALGDEQEMSRRRQLFDVLARLGPTVVPHAVALLTAEPWYVRRNALALLREIGRGFDTALLCRLMGDPDHRVRLEVIKAAAAMASSLPESFVAQGLTDPHSVVAEATVRLVATHRIAAGRRPLTDLLRQADPLGRQQRLRLRALAALGEIGDPRSLQDLAPFFRRWFPSVAPEEQRAAFVSLALYPEGARLPLVERGLRFRDPEIRRACLRLTKSAPPARQPRSSSP